MTRQMGLIKRASPAQNQTRKWAGGWRKGATQSVGVVSMGVLALVMLMGAPALAADLELWVPPAKASQEKKFFDWALANLGGETHFTFAVPENYTSFVGAKLVVMPDQQGNFEFNLRVAASQDTKLYDFKTYQILGLLSPVIGAGELREIDVSQLIVDLETNTGTLVKGEDYVSINFELIGRKASTQVLGLRFLYVGSNGVGTGGGPAGPYWPNRPDGC